MPEREGVSRVLTNSSAHDVAKVCEIVELELFIVIQGVVKYLLEVAGNSNFSQTFRECDCVCQGPYQVVSQLMATLQSKMLMLLILAVVLYVRNCIHLPVIACL